MENKTPPLVNLCLEEIIKHTDNIKSLNAIPDHLRHRISAKISANAHFLELLTRNSPTDLRIFDCSNLSEEEVMKAFLNADFSKLTVLQLAFCGNCVTNSLLDSFGSFPALVNISLSGADKLSDEAIGLLGLSAPRLLSINLTKCSNLTSESIDIINGHLGSFLRELYICNCHQIDAWEILPAIKGMKDLEVLSMEGMQTVTDEFVNEFVKARGRKLKDLNFSGCQKLTDKAVKCIAENCYELYALEISALGNATDAALQFLANGRCAIGKLILCGNSFSDEGISKFLEASGECLDELDLSFMGTVDHKTACSLKRNLQVLDLSYCDNITLESVVLILRKCSSLKHLDLRGKPEITNEALDGHTYSNVQILLDTTPNLDKLYQSEIQQGPLRYPATQACQ